MSQTGEAWINSRRKRAMDVVLASAYLPVAGPLGMAALGFSRIVDGEGAVFSQKRTGQNGQTFTVRKIRTMRHDPDGLASNKDRITPFGAKLRPLGIDEFPQVLNVLNGTMSAVGPRAISDTTLERMQADLPRNFYDEWEDAFFRSKPGLVSTYAVAIRHLPDTARAPQLRAKLDIHDFKDASFGHDAKLLLNAGVVGAKLINSYLSGGDGRLADEIAELSSAQAEAE